MNEPSTETRDLARSVVRATLVPIRLSISYAFLLRGDRPILLDTGGPKDFSRLQKALATLGVALGDLSLILHTHAHWDHAGSTAELRRHTSAPVAVHAADAPMMRRGDNGILRPTCLFSRVFKPLLDRSFPGTEPDLLFDREMELADFGVPARIVFTPGHTSGSITVLTNTGDALIGDLLMGGYLGGALLPRRPGLHYFAEDVDQVRASLRKLLALAPARIYPAHGGPLDPADVARWLSGFTAARTNP